ncbi:hypothetical protein ACFLTX_03560 [Chloroflexota bacterium]
MEPNLLLALEDFVPVLLTMLALVWLTRLAFSMNRQSGYIAVIGSLLVVLGGLLKAASKLLWVVSGEQISWMENSLFLLMAPGFAMLSWSIWTGQRKIFRGIQTRIPYLVPIIILILVAGGAAYFSGIEQGRTWFIILLTSVVLMTTIMLILLSRHAWHYQHRLTAFLFLLYLLITLALNGMARTPSPSISMEWIKQLVNTTAAAILAYASWRLWRENRDIKLM